MRDPKDKTQYPRTKALSNSLRLKSLDDVKRRQNVSNIVSRLPILRTLNEAQNQLVKLTPTWQRWCAKQQPVDQSTSAIENYASLSNLDGKVLTIKCTQSSTATLLKHRQSSLLEAINNNGFEQIKTVRVIMSLSQPDQEFNSRSSDDPSFISNTSPKKPPSNELTRPRPSVASLKSIEATQSLIKNEQLAKSLKRLANTLKKHF